MLILFIGIRWFLRGSIQEVVQALYSSEMSLPWQARQQVLGQAKTIPLFQKLPSAGSFGAGVKLKKKKKKTLIDS